MSTSETYFTAVITEYLQGKHVFRAELMDSGTLPCMIIKARTLRCTGQNPSEPPEIPPRDPFKARNRANATSRKKKAIKGSGQNPICSFDLYSS